MSQALRIPGTSEVPDVSQIIEAGLPIGLWLPNPSPAFGKSSMTVKAGSNAERTEGRSYDTLKRVVQCNIFRIQIVSRATQSPQAFRGIVNMHMYEDASRVGREAMNSTLKSFSVMTAGMQQIASETSDFAKRSYEQQTTTLEKLMQARSMDTTLEVQNEFAKSAYQNWVSQATKLGEIYADMAREACKPFEHNALLSYGRGAEQARKAVDKAATAIEKQPAG